MHQKPSVTGFVFVALIYLGLLAGLRALPNRYNNPSPVVLKASVVQIREKTDEERKVFGEMVSRDHLSWGWE